MPSKVAPRHYPERIIQKYEVWCSVNRGKALPDRFCRDPPTGMDTEKAPFLLECRQSLVIYVYLNWSWGPHDASWFPGLLWSCTRVTVHAGIGEYSFCTPSLQPVLPLIPSFPKMSPGPVHRMGRTSGVRKGPRLLGFAQPFSIRTSGPALSAWLPPSR